MASGAVQFWGYESVLKAYDSRDAETWAIFQGKSMITRGSGRESLADFLTMLSGGYSNAVYALKIYEDLNESDVKDNTPCDGSFSFSLAADGVRMGGPHSGGLDPVLNARLTAIEKKLTGADSDEETIGSVAMGLLKDPDKLVTLITGINLLMGRPVPQQMLAGIERRSAAETEEIDDDKRLARLQKALDTLEKNDPKFLEHLEKLADLSERNPATFQGLLTMLKNF